MNSNIPEFILMLVFGLMLYGCANPVSPQGGPKDQSPPVLVKAEPPLFSTNFNKQKVKLTFDEFIQLEDLSNQLIVSPPMQENPEIVIKGKSVVINFKEEFKPNTTYNIFFGNAVVDLTEKNPVENFQYVFATGNVLDSLTFKGEVRDAFTLEPVQGVSVMLYLDNNDTIPYDSLPYFTRPYYMTKTSESGQFTFRNLADTSFKIFALEDGNSNLLFDQPSERIAFADSLITPFYIPIHTQTDTTAKSDSLMVNDSTVPDTNAALTLAADYPKFLEPEPLLLKLFEEVDSTQKLLKATLAKANKIYFAFKRPVDSLQIELLKHDTVVYQFLAEWNESRDTLNHWITERNTDTIKLILKDELTLNDTLEIALTKASRGRNKEKEKEETKGKLKVVFPKRAPLPGRPLVFNFSYPVSDYNPTDFLLVEGKDSLTIRPIFNDSLKLSAKIDHPWKFGTSYFLEIPDSVFTDILNQSHDTLTHGFNSIKLEDIGNIITKITFEEPGMNTIVQVLRKEKVLQESFINSDTSLTFRYLPPGEYTLKAISDVNHSGKWDPGNYIYQIKPETVHIFPKVITVRANWDIEEIWELP